MRFKLLTFLLATGAIGAVHAADDDGPAVTPYRPSVSTPAALSAPGWLELEAGGQRSRGEDPARADSIPYTLKLAFTPDWGIRLGGDAWVNQRAADGTTTRGLGDTSAVLKRRFAVDDAQAFGLELGVKAPTAHHGLGSGHADQSVNGIYSADFAEAWHTDVNLTGTRIGGVDAGTGRWQAGWAAALSRSLDAQWGAVGELSGTHQRGERDTAQGLFAVSYAPAKSVTFDFGVSKGFDAASGGWSVFGGLTMLVAPLF